MNTAQKPKIALVHEYLIQYGGAEKTLESLIELFPEAPIYTAIYKKNKMTDKINAQKIICPKNVLFEMFPKYFTFLMPFVFEKFDLSDYDIVISDGTAWSKGVHTTPEQLHISYVHTPPRFLYGYPVESQKRNKWYFKPAVALIDYFLRIWDYNAAQRPNLLLTNSINTQKRIKKFYRRDAKVIYPPIDIQFPSEQKNSAETEDIKKYKDFYLLLGRFSAYKNFDFIIKIFNKIHAPLIVAGTGIEESKLKSIAKKNITFVGRVSEEQKNILYENCRGLINPVVEEDLGMVPIEAMAHGKPVLAHRSGGHLETIQENFSGMFFDDLTEDHFTKIFSDFDKKIRDGYFNNEKIKESVQKYGKETFKKEFSDFVQEAWKNYA